MSGYKTMRGTIWISGRNYVTSLPTDFGEKVEKEYDSKIEKIRIDDKIMITPPFDPFKRKSLKTKANPNNFAELKMKAVSAYLNGYDSIDISLTSPVPDEIIKKLQLSIPYMKIEFTSPKLHRMFFSELYEISLEKVFEDVGETFKELNNETRQIFKAFPNSNSMDKMIVYVKSLETKLDNLCFQLRRYLNKALSFGGLYENLKLKSDKDIIYLTGVFGFFERLGDLHLEIGKRIREISGKGTKLKLNSFLSYYNHSYDTIPIAIEAQENPWRGLEVIQGKFSEWDSYKDRVLKLDKENVKNFIYAQKDPVVIRELVILEGKLGAIPDISSNICELAWDMHRDVLSEPMPSK